MPKEKKQLEKMSLTEFFATVELKGLLIFLTILAGLLTGAFKYGAYTAKAEALKENVPKNSMQQTIDSSSNSNNIGIQGDSNTIKIQK